MDYLFALQNIREAAPAFINYFFIFISEYFVLACFIFPSIIYWAFDKSAGATILFGYGLSFELNQTIKNCACVYRPWIKDSRLYVEPHAVKSATGYSFPSGHTTTAASIYGGFSVWQKKRKVVVVLMSLLILLTAFARNWLGAHTLQDVVCAVLLVALWLSLLYIIKMWIARKPARDTIVCFAGIAVALVLLVFACVKKYPLDYAADGTLLVDPYLMLTDCFTGFGCFCGSLLGWWIERHFIVFSTDVSKKRKVLRVIPGIIIGLMIYLLFGKIFAFTGSHFSHLIKYFSLFFYIFCIHPFVFNFIESRKDK